jgi:antirestriction protein ArdC
VRKGERASIVLYWKQDFRDTNDNDDSEEQEKRAPRFFASGHPVFNADQVEGYERPTASAEPEKQRISQAEQFFAAIPAEVRHGGNGAYYCPTTDHVQIPNFEQFKKPVSYYSVLAHELTHWTGAPLRLNRDLSARFGDEAYAMEELVAELGAAFVCADLRLENEPRKDHAAYIASWLKVLKSDRRAIFTAASKAQAANDHMYQSRASKAA